MDGECFAVGSIAYVESFRDGAGRKAEVDSRLLGGGLDSGVLERI